jgi:hypothetical protein
VDVTGATASQENLFPGESKDPSEGQRQDQGYLGVSNMHEQTFCAASRGFRAFAINFTARTQ